MNKQLIDPNAIYLAKAMNPRPLNQGFIESLRESMQEQGFLPQYPVKVFRTENLSCLETDLQYAVVSGMHRTSAAQLAKIDEILCEVYTGDDDVFVEMMMTDNFEYDPMQNSELGQIFSNSEKRKACKRLLYIPKFLRMTNAALSDAWHTSESNVRRWRKEVTDTFNFKAEAPSNGGGGLPTFPEQLSRVGITPERLIELKDIDASREREDANGNTVQVRKSRQDASDDAKDEFFEEIRMDCSGIREESDIDFDWDTVKTYAAQKWKIEAGWGMYRDMHIDQLRKLHKLVLEQDADFIQACTTIHKEIKDAAILRETLDKALKKTTRVFCKLIDADNEYDDTFEYKWKTFEGMVKSQLNIEEFGNKKWDYDNCETADERRAVIEQHQTVQEAIAEGADWVADFMKKEQAAAVERRKKVSELWTEKRQAAIAAIHDYPRDVSFDRIVGAAEKAMYEPHGYFSKIFDAEVVSDRKNIGTLESEAKNLDRLIRDVKADADWIQKIPATQPRVEGVTEVPEPEPSETAEFDKQVDRLINASNLVNNSIEEIPWFANSHDKQDSVVLCDRAADVLACDRDLLWVVFYEEDLPEEFTIADVAKWDTILRQIHAAITSKADWVMAEPFDEEDEEPAPEPETEFTLTMDDLHNISLDEIFQHVADRVIHLPVDDENEVMVDMARILGKASRGMRGTQLYLLMKFAIHDAEKRYRRRGHRKGGS